jgi:two-component SAPR family response regulator
MYILALDDEQYALESLAEQLKLVFPEANIQEETKALSALSWAKNLADSGEELSYAFLDIQMRGMNGIEVATQLKILHPKVKLFFCTAYSEYAYDAFSLCAKGYLLKPIEAKEIERVLDEMVSDWRDSQNPLPKDIRIQTFGNFGVFVDGELLAFEREKAKELLAYLVDRHGAPVTTAQIATVLWEEAYDRKLKNKTTAIVSSLRSTLKNAGIESILIKTWNNLAIDVSKVKCDSYDFEKGDLIAINSFHGEYMSNYSWAEFTTGHYVTMNERRNKS